MSTQKQKKEQNKERYRKITLRDPRLRRLRANLRLVLRQAYFQEHDRLSDLIDELRKENKDHRQISREYRNLGYAYDDSIITCGFCADLTDDRIYVPVDHQWYCPNCYENKLPKSFHKDWEPFYPFGIEGVHEYYRRLEKWFSSDQPSKEGPFGDSRYIFSEMGVPKQKQDKFINTLKEYGGFDDGEILMNTWKNVRRDFGINDEEAL